VPGFFLLMHATAPTSRVWPIASSPTAAIPATAARRRRR